MRDLALLNPKSNPERELLGLLRLGFLTLFWGGEELLETDRSEDPLLETEVLRARSSGILTVGSRGYGREDL